MSLYFVRHSLKSISVPSAALCDGNKYIQNRALFKLHSANPRSSRPPSKTTVCGNSVPTHGRAQSRHKLVQQSLRSCSWTCHHCLESGCSREEKQLDRHCIVAELRLIWSPDSGHGILAALKSRELLLYVHKIDQATTVPCDPNGAWCNFYLMVLSVFPLNCESWQAGVQEIIRLMQ